MYKMGNILFTDARTANNSANLTGIYLIFFMGHNSPIPKILNNKWASATDNGAIVPETMLARREVIVVPIFAPKV